MGGGISSLSKIVVVGPPEHAAEPSEVDCEYTFVQVGVEDGTIDTAGNCGNLSSMVGCFAIDEGICSARVEKNGRGRVCSWNTNTKKRIDTVFPITAGTQGDSARPMLNREETGMAGVPGKASRIDLEFRNPAGARTGSLLPTGRPVDVLNLPDNDLTEVSLVDATNPTVILPYHEVRRIRSRAVSSHYLRSPQLRILLGLAPSAEVNYESEATLKVLETIRAEGAKAMKLPDAPSQPKIVVIRPPNTEVAAHEDLVVQALSMGAPHKAVPMTVGLCLGVAANIKGTVAQRMVAQTRQKAKWGDNQGNSVILRHPGGTVEVNPIFDSSHQPLSVSVTRTGRWLMKGVVWW